MSEIDIFVSSTGDLNIITLDHMKVNIAFVGNTEHFDNQFDLTGSQGFDGMKVDNIKPQKIALSSPLITV